jgi:hypothetical protein
LAPPARGTQTKRPRVLGSHLGKKEEEKRAKKRTEKAERRRAKEKEAEEKKKQAEKEAKEKGTEEKKAEKQAEKAAARGPPFQKGKKRKATEAARSNEVLRAAPCLVLSYIARKQELRLDLYMGMW